MSKKDLDQKDLDKENQKKDTEKTLEELKKEAEEADAKYKAARDSFKKEDDDAEEDHDDDAEERANMIRRRDKANQKREKLEKGETLGKKPSEKSVKSDELDVRDLLALRDLKIPEGSEKAKILEKYKKGGLISSYEEGASHVGIKAEFAEIDAADTAKSVIDENDTPEERTKTTKEIVKSYRATGRLPNDEKAVKAVAESNLEEMML